MGLIMMAACNNVEAYAAAQVFYTVGNNGLQYSLSVFVADTSKLRNRGLMQAIVSTPNLITCWLAGPISSGFLRGPGWRWAFGMFTILLLAVALPLWGLLLNNYFKAKKQGLVPKRSGQQSFLGSITYYCREFDAIGLLLISTGFAFFLLPFDLYTLQAKGFSSGHFHVGGWSCSDPCFCHLGKVLRIDHLHAIFPSPGSDCSRRLHPRRDTIYQLLLLGELFQLFSTGSKWPKRHACELRPANIHGLLRSLFARCWHLHSLHRTVQAYHPLLRSTIEHIRCWPDDQFP